MNYGKKGVRAKQKALNSKSQKWGRKLALTCVKIMLAAVVGIGICGVAAGIGAFRGILSSTPTIRLSDVVAVGEATIVYDKEGNINVNPDSLTVLKECYIEPAISGAKAYDSFQFVRQGYFCVDSKDSSDDALVFNRIVSLKSSFKLNK